MDSKILICFPALLILLSFSGKHTDEPSSAAAIQCLETGLPISNNEHLIYKAYYNYGRLWVGAGSLDFSIQNDPDMDQNLLHAVTYGKTNATFDKVFKVRDKYETWIDPSTMLPIKFNRDVQEGKFIFNRNYQFERDSGYVNTFYNIDGKHREQRLEDGFVCSQDLLSMVYYLRAVSLSGYSPGDRIPIDVIIDGKLQSLSVKFVGAERLKTRLGTFDCLVFKPQLLKGDYFNEEEALTVWMTNDKNRIPIRAQADILIGSLKADLATYENLQHAFSAKLK